MLAGLAMAFSSVFVVSNPGRPAQVRFEDLGCCGGPLLYTMSN
ncbi:MAG: hypothetical protein ABIP99_00425 [Ilumatobacteraceae bacterium]